MIPRHQPNPKPQSEVGFPLFNKFASSTNVNPLQNRFPVTSLQEILERNQKMQEYAQNALCISQLHQTLATTNLRNVSDENDWKNSSIDIRKLKVPTLYNHEEQCSKLKLKGEILKLLDLDDKRDAEKNPSKTSWQKPNEKWESFAEFNARMNTRPDGTIIGSRKYVNKNRSLGTLKPVTPIPRPAKLSSSNKPIHPNLTRRTTLEAKLSQSGDSNSRSIQFMRFPPTRVSFESNTTSSGFPMKFENRNKKPFVGGRSEMEKTLDKLFPLRKWNNEEIMAMQTKEVQKPSKAENRRGQVPSTIFGSKVWNPPPKATISSDGIVRTRLGVQILRDPRPPVRNDLEIKVECRKKGPIRPAKLPSLISHRVSNQGVPLVNLNTSNSNTPLTEEMVGGVNKFKLSPNIQPYVPRNAKDDDLTWTPSS